MLRNYFSITYRLFLRNKVYSFINILGFAIGLSAFILISLFIRHEVGYEQNYDDHDRIYRVTRSWHKNGEETLHLATIAAPVGPLLAQDYPDMVEEAVRIDQVSPTLKIEEKTFKATRMFLAEDNFFRVFSAKMIKGDPQTALSELNSIVISETIARKYFGEADPMGKSIEIRHIGPYTVTGIFEDLPENTHFKYEILASFVSTEMSVGTEELLTNWSENNFYTYIKFSENGLPAQLEDQLNDFIDRHNSSKDASDPAKLSGRKVSEGSRLHLQKISDIHLRSHLSSELEPNGDIRTVYIYSSVAFFILLIASINFINLSTARSTKRAREVAMRKVTGASRGQLISQFLIESLSYTLLALILAIVTVDLILPLFNNFISRELSFNEGGGISTTLILIIIGLLVGILSGIYPAFYLSKFQPIRVLRSQSLPGKSSTPLRNILVITQFAISITLIISIGTIDRQLKYIQTKDTGFNRENILVLSARGSISQNLETFKERLLAFPGIKGISSSRLIPSNDLVNMSGAKTLDGEHPGPLPFRLPLVSIDYDYFENLGIKLLAGRNFSREFATDDSASFILSAMTVRQLNWGEPAQAIDRPFSYDGTTGTIIGVVDDINFETLHNPISPILYRILPSQNYQLCIRIDEREMTATIDFIKSIYKEYAPESIFNYTFLDDAYTNNYRAEFQMGKIMILFSVLAIIIACLGLFGLSSFLSELKSKEVGIRKVMGASISHVVAKLSMEFTRWVLLANLIAWPAAYLLMMRWLRSFAYHINIPWLIFILAVFISLGIALLTVSFQAFRSAVRNPVDSIKSE
ncbi:MAG TPA: ABC transporter permease [Bacteroides sp.]|nr:ABC transporter permease [Bacteroides sp.]